MDSHEHMVNLVKLLRKEKPPDIPPDASAILEWADFIAGFVAGMTGVIVGHPFDTIKVRQQVKGPEYRTLYGCVKTTLLKEGPKGFYKGMAFPLLAEGGRNCIFFGVYESLKSDELPLSYANIAFAGAMGGAAQAVPGTTVELVKIKLQDQTEKKRKQRAFRGPAHCLHHICKNHGFAACFRGISLCIPREITSFAAYMVSFEFLCRRFHPQGPDECNLSVLLLTGGLAGSFCWFVNLPLDYVKSRIQADSLKAPKYTSAKQCVKEVLETKGVREFYRGLPAVMMRAFALNAVTLSAYSLFRRQLLSLQ